MTPDKQCKECKTTETDMWWKCCPKHCTEQGPDVVCSRCAKLLHRLCVMKDCTALGSENAMLVLGHFDKETFAVSKGKEIEVFVCDRHVETVKSDKFIGLLI